ncbi:hypothetical protein H8356DRAFT_934841 [Neocallimastix lanati (nom. inval.)]|jgi:DNA-binding TFAR19-related protein (PDSD5 family)|uniref:Uncharacterized protein n=1 Tax=Neocallimastix californiae TaxID=1754190 RepID=A0A1Y2DCN7_9FUNG|nr:hypothetical protein H8356DRAFT_934841 [Neocallimastix sp. JGI-2020a]ORY57029.1 hypothetical protein LY90DRAFT_506562 [Neocallimastix californiae]|eukprot:ORY57029.1 hypothetical protein LY90DRAFT_506562 [Neocallimastix californiae]
MRFQQTLLLQKQQVEEMDRKDKTEQAFAPIKETINKQYISVRTWVNPMALSLERVKHRQSHTANNINNFVTNLQNTSNISNISNNSEMGGSSSTSSTLLSSRAQFSIPKTNSSLHLFSLNYKK